MPIVYPKSDQDPGDLARQLLDLAGDDSAEVKVVTGEGQGFEISDELHTKFIEARKQAAKSAKPAEEEEKESSKPTKPKRRKGE